MTATDQQLARAIAFKTLHERTGVLVLPNPWDAGSAKMLASLGFEALATTSAGLAFSTGKPDGVQLVTLDETLENARTIINATGLPVSADLENGYGDDPASCAATIRRAAAAGLSGGSIEDATGHPDTPIYPFELAVERIKAAVQAARELPHPFVLTARAENFLYGRPDLADTIRRLQAFAEAGADVLYAPGLQTKEDINAVVKAVAPKPVNVLLGPDAFSVEELAALGVKRITLGSSLARVAYSAFFRAAASIRQKGSFDTAKDVMTYAELNAQFKS